MFTIKKWNSMFNRIFTLCCSRVLTLFSWFHWNLGAPHLLRWSHFESLRHMAVLAPRHHRDGNQFRCDFLPPLHLLHVVPRSPLLYLHRSTLQLLFGLPRYFDCLKIVYISYNLHRWCEHILSASCGSSLSLCSFSAFHSFTWFLIFSKTTRNAGKSISWRSPNIS